MKLPKRIEELKSKRDSLPSDNYNRGIEDCAKELLPIIREAYEIIKVNKAQLEECGFLGLAERMFLNMHKDLVEDNK